MSILRHASYSAAALAVIAGIPYCANMWQQREIARVEQKHKQLDAMLKPVSSKVFEVIDIQKQQAIVRDANGIWVMRVGDILPNGEAISAIGNGIMTDKGSTYRVK
ncbi:hypothetical protein ACTOV4_02805 [Brucella sp. C7-11G]